MVWRGEVGGGEVVETAAAAVKVDEAVDQGQVEATQVMAVTATQTQMDIDKE